MNRLFLRTLLRVVGVVGVVLAVALSFLVPRLNARRERVFTSTMAPTATLCVDLLARERAAGRDVAPLLERMSVALGGAVALIPLAEGPKDPDKVAALARGEVVAVGPVPTSVVWARMGDRAELLRIGPLTSETLMNPEALVLTCTVALVLLFLALYAQMRPIERRLEALGRAAAAFGQGSLTARAEEGPVDEVGRLAREFNDMAAQIHRLVATQKELLRSVSHDLRTPLQRMHFAIEAAGSASGPERAQAVARLARDIEELQALVEDLLTWARVREGEFEPASVDVRALVTEIAETHAELGGDVSVTARVEAPLSGRLEVRLLRRALSNLIANGQRHARSRVEILAALEAGTIRIDVDDDGPGVPPAEVERIFEPFRRGAMPSGAKAGHGLGLAIVRSIAQRHGGTVTAQTSPLGGARFRLEVPVDVKPGGAPVRA